MNADTLGLFVPIIAMFIPIIAIVSGTMQKIRRERLLHETVRQLSAQGQAIPPELLQPRERERTGRRPLNLEWTPKRQLRAAVLNIGLGIGLGAFLYLLTPQSPYWAVSLLPLCVGVALLVLWKIESSAAADGRMQQ